MKYKYVVSIVYQKQVESETKQVLVSGVIQADSARMALDIALEKENDLGSPCMQSSIGCGGDSGYLSFDKALGLAFNE